MQSQTNFTMFCNWIRIGLELDWNWFETVWEYLNYIFLGPPWFDKYLNVIEFKQYGMTRMWWFWVHNLPI